MELIDVLRTTAATREFRPDPVPDDVLWRVLDTARFGPSGGNVQGWRVVVVADPARRRALRDLYLTGWYDYLALTMAGLRPWAPTNDRAAEAAALPAATDLAAQAAQGPGGFAEHLDEVPVLLALFVDLSALAAVDRDADRYTFAGGASVYPFAWNLLLARAERRARRGHHDDGHPPRGRDQDAARGAGALRAGRRHRAGLSGRAADAVVPRVGRVVHDGRHRRRRCLPRSDLTLSIALRGQSAGIASHHWHHHWSPTRMRSCGCQQYDRSSSVLR